MDRVGHCLPHPVHSYTDLLVKAKEAPLGAALLDAQVGFLYHLVVSQVFGRVAQHDLAGL